MTLVLQRFIEVCLLRAGPQDLPASRFLVAVALGLYGAVGLVLGLRALSPGEAMLVVTLDVGLLAGLLFVLLWIRQLLNRYLQALTALLGTGAVLEVVAAPLLFWQQTWSADAMTPAMVAGSLLFWAWLLWSLVVIGHILRHTLSTVFPVGIMLGLLYMFVSFSIMSRLMSPA
jgi:hypothetical protein